LATVSRRGIVAAPKPGDGPLTERRADRELPSEQLTRAPSRSFLAVLTALVLDVDASRFRWWRTMPIFVVLVACSSAAIFNYQKSSSPVVAGTMYALRTSPKAREYLGDEIYFKNQIPWIGGEMNQLQGRINISFTVKGTKSTGVMRFASNRPTAKGMFETTEWSLETHDGRKIDLLEDSDPFKAISAFNSDFDDDNDDDNDTPSTRGFRQMNKK
jgi:cytochrome c oxidase assembly factor 1